MIRLEATDLSKAEIILRHPEIAATAGLAADSPVYVCGPDRAILLVMDDDDPVGFVGFHFRDRETAEMSAGFLTPYRSVVAHQACETAITMMFLAGFEEITFRIDKSNRGALAGARVLRFVRGQQRGDDVFFSTTRDKWLADHSTVRH